MKHGTLSAYTKRRCRCPLCRTFWNAYMRWRRAYLLGRRHSACPTCSCPMPEHPVEDPSAPDLAPES